MERQSKCLEVTVLLRDIVSLFKQNMGKLYEEMGITAPQGMVIGMLSRSGTMKISDLSSKLGLSNSTISGIVDRLELQGILERVRSREDKRVVYVSISSAFKERHQDFHKMIEANLERILSRGTEEELTKITEGLGTMKRLLSNCNIN